MLNGIDIYHGDDITPQLLNTMIRDHQLYFVFIKSGTGAQGKDSRFTEYWQICRSAGLVCGAYHWFWPASDPTQQANNFIEQYRRVSRAGVLPPVIDIEWTWNAGDRQSDENELWHKVSPPERTRRIREYLGKVQLELGVRPTIYTANSFWNELIRDNASAEDNSFFLEGLLWIADPNGNGRIPGPWQNTTPSFTQTHFGENAHSNDLFEILDHDVFNGNLLQFLNTTVPGFTLMKGFPFSNVVKVITTGIERQGPFT